MAKNDTKDPHKKGQLSAIWRKFAASTALATVLLGSASAPTGFAVYHTAPLVEGRPRDELRVLKLVLERRTELPRLIGTLSDLARRVGTRRVAVRLQGEYPDAYRTLMGLGARVRWTDLRMSAYGWSETAPADGMVLSNWEI